MEQNTTLFGREIKPKDAKLGDILLIPSTLGNIFMGKCIRGDLNGTDEAIIGFIYDENYGNVPVFENDRCWLIEELSIVVVDSMRYNQKPFALYVPNEDCYLSKRAPDIGGPLESHFTNFASMSKGFPSFSAASEYLRKYLTGRCKVVVLKDCNNA